VTDPRVRRQRARSARHPAVRIVAFTSSNDAATAREFLDAGACTYIDKVNIPGVVDYVATRVDANGSA